MADNTESHYLGAKLIKSPPIMKNKLRIPLGNTNYYVSTEKNIEENDIEEKKRVYCNIIIYI